jgi:FAD/FMN-containing dehydrogenase
MAASNKLHALREEYPELQVFEPSDAQWAERRETRGQVGQDLNPLGIALPKNAEQVGQIVRWARKHQVEMSVRSGGNDFFGRNVVDNGIVIDMRAINFIHVAGDKATAAIGGGVITKDLIYKFEDEGVVAPFGNTWVVGYIGWATLGGYGPLTNLLGMGFEGILAAQLVNSQGEVVEATGDMLEGIRGMGGNLGIITSLTIKVYPARKVCCSMVPYRRMIN